jgi:predicted amidohydrolase
MRISIAQCSAETGDPVSNANQAWDFISQAKGDVVVFPELYDVGYDLEKVNTVEQSACDAFRQSFREFSDRSGKTLVSGCLRRDSSTGRVLNQAVVFQSGEETTAYSKVHLCQTHPVDEEKVFQAGNELGMFQLGGWKFGLTICYDLRFPEIFTAYRMNGVDAHLLISAWPLERASHWLSLLKARAIETQSYVVACGLTGNLKGWPFCGRSVVFDPWGNIVNEADAFGSMILESELSKDTLERYRSMHPIGRHKKFELYNSWRENVL